MRDATREELEDYFSFSRRPSGPVDGFNKDQAMLVGLVMRNSGVLDCIGDASLRGMREGVDVNSVMTSMYVAVFQMGREFEARRLDLALRGRVGENP